MRKIEDELCIAGLRNPAATIVRWPSLHYLMQKIRVAIVQAQVRFPELKHLSTLLGDKPNRLPPSDVNNITN